VDADGTVIELDVPDLVRAVERDQRAVADGELVQPQREQQWLGRRVEHDSAPIVALVDRHDLSRFDAPVHGGAYTPHPPRTLLDASSVSGLRATNTPCASASF